MSILYWIDEEHVGQSPPSEAIVCENIVELGCRLRQLSLGSKFKVCIVLGPKLQTPVHFDVPGFCEATLELDNQSGRDIELGELTATPARAFPEVS